MVYFKVSDGQVTRKFRVNPGEITFDQLKERIVALFPKALEGSQQSLHLKYRDADGDLITISTNDEFQEALAELPKDHIWKLQIYGGAKKPSARPVQRLSIPSDFFFQPSRSPFGGFGGFSDPWFGFGRRPSWLSNPWTTLDREFDRMLDEHTELLNALHNTEGSGGAEATPEAKQEGEGAVQAQSSGDVADTSDGKMKIKNFGSWEPKEFDGPFGKGRIIGPVGYYISWGSGPEAEEKEAEGKKEEAAAKEGGDQATKEGAESKETTQ